MNKETLPKKNFASNRPLQFALIIIVIAIFFGPTLTSEFALDDGLVISENPYTKKGIGGLGDIFTKDAYQWFYEKNSSAQVLSGGRYRPLSIAFFAVVYEFFGLEPSVYHFFNLLIYAATCLLLLILLRDYFFPQKPILAFLTTLVFAIHPIHTEAVANIKGCDELLSFLLLVLTLLYLFKYIRQKKRVQLTLSLTFYFLALLSKENGITFLAVIHLSLYFFAGHKWIKSFVATLPFLIIAVLYFVIRVNVVGTVGGAMDDVMNNWALYATSGEQFGSSIYVLLKYLGLVFWPHPLSYDYGFQHIPYQDIFSPLVLLSLFVHLSLLIVALRGLKKRKTYSYAILFYLITISIISNLAFNIGATMGERLIYHSSFGFALGFAWLLLAVYKRMDFPAKKQIGYGFIGLLILISGYKSITRGQDWKNNRNLFLTDVKTVPNSIKANSAAGNELITAYTETQDVSHLHQALLYFEKARNLYPIGEDEFKRSLYLYNNYLNTGYAHYTLGNLDEAERNWLIAKSIKPFHENTISNLQSLSTKYMLDATEMSRTDLAQSILLYEKSVSLNENNIDAWYNLGGAYYTAGRYTDARNAFLKTLEINPRHEQANQGLAAVNQVLGISQ